MKKQSIAALMLIAACSVKAQDVPQKVKDAFSKKFPSAQKVKWNKEKNDEWEAEFKMNGKEYSANFTSNGEWKETESEIKVSELPAPVKKTLETEFAGYKIEEAELAETPQGTFYEVEVEKDKKEFEVALSKDGKVIKKEESKDEDKD